MHTEDYCKLWDALHLRETESPKRTTSWYIQFNQ